MVRPKLVPPRGVLYWKPSLDTPGYARFWPSADLAPFVEHFWTVEWDEPEPVVRQVLPHPSVQLVLERGASRVAGVHRGRFVTILEGHGRVLGTKFLPGGFRPFLGRPLSSITGQSLPLEEFFGSAGGRLESRALRHADPVTAFALVEDFLRALAPQPDDNVARVGRIIERAAADRDITRVEHLLREFGLGARALQRLFDDYVGVSPKWVIQRYRLHEAAERIAQDPTVDGTRLAADLGYADQAHFIRDFKRLVGTTPADYSRSLRSGSA
jgi:AraC-like DNA-binding protein